MVMEFGREVQTTPTLMKASISTTKSAVMVSSLGPQETFTKATTLKIFAMAMEK